MRVIEGFDETLELLRPHWDEIHVHFECINEEFVTLSSREHETVGRVLRAHLVVEHFLNRFLETHFGHEDVAKMRLNFQAKSLLIPKTGSSASFVRLGVIELNSIRNKFAHRLDYDIKPEDMTAMIEVLRYARSTEVFERPLDIIEGFITVAVAWLSVPPRHLQRIFEEAFAQARVLSDEGREVEQNRSRPSGKRRSAIRL